MARPFLNESFDLCPRYGSNFEQSYPVRHQQVNSGDSFSKLDWPFPLLRYELDFSNQGEAGFNYIRDLFDRSFGTFGGFRFRHRKDYSTNGYTLAPTALDQELLPAAVNPAPNRFQLVRWYGTVQLMGQSPLRLLRKIVSGSVVVAVDGVTQSGGYTVDHSTGIVEFTVAPSAGAVVTAGCYFDIPMRFESDLSGITYTTYNAISLSAVLVEILNP